MEDYNQIIFCNYVWEHLSRETDDVVREFVNKMVVANKHYVESGGTYPTIEYIMAMAKDTVAQSKAIEEKKKFDCAINNKICEQYGHEGQSCECDCHKPKRYDCPDGNDECQTIIHELDYECDCKCHDVSESEDSDSDTPEQRREKIRKSWEKFGQK